MDVTVLEVSRALIEVKHQGGTIFGTLENKSVGLGTIAPAVTPGLIK